MQDPKRVLLSHLVATIIFRGNVAVREAPETFGDFQIGGDVRTPVAILAHIGDLMEGSAFLLKGEMRMLNSEPLPWNKEVTRFFVAAKDLRDVLDSDAPFEIPIENLTQGPIADVFTHIGQIVILRRAAGIPVRSEPYFQADLNSTDI